MLQGIAVTRSEGSKDENCPNCGDNHHGPQKAIIAVSSHSTFAVVVWSTPALACDMREAMIDAGDAWDLSKVKGLTVWEGRIQYVRTGGNPECPVEWDVDYQGTFKTMTKADWDNLRDDVQPG